MNKNTSSEKVFWLAGKLNASRKAVRKGMLETMRAYEEAKKANQPIVGFRPEYPNSQPAS